MLIQFLRLGVMPGQNTCAMHVGVKANAVMTIACSIETDEVSVVSDTSSDRPGLHNLWGNS